MQIDIYDFDETIFPKDSGSNFWFFCLLHYPQTLLWTPVQLVTALLFVFRIISLTQIKHYFFGFVRFIDTDKAVKKYWDKNEKLIYPWFAERTRDAVVISASPDFLLNEIATRIGIEHLICSKHDKKTGAIVGQNCRDGEKVKRFYQEFPEDTQVVCVFSDSIKHDRPIFSLGERCFHIVKGERVEFDYSTQYSAK